MSTSAGGWSQQKAKEHLFRVNKGFIIKNICVTPTLVERLMEVEVISAKHGREVLQMSDKDGPKVRRLMDAIEVNINLRGNFELFLDALDNSGHSILATCLRGLYLDYDPALEREPKLNMQEAVTFGRIMASSQYRAAVMKGDDADAIPILRSLKQTIHEQAQKIESLEYDLSLVRMKSDNLNDHVTEVKHELEEKERRTNDYITLQSKASVARENHLKRLETRLRTVNDGLLDLNRLLQRSVSSKLDSISDRDTEEMKFLTLKQNILSLVKELEASREHLEVRTKEWDREKRAALKLLHEPDAFVPLEVTVERHAKRMEKQNAKVMRHLKNLAQTLNSSCSREELEEANMKSLCSIIFAGVEDKQKELEDLVKKVAEQSRKVNSSRTTRQSSVASITSGNPKLSNARVAMAPITSKEIDFKDLSRKDAVRK